MLSCHLAVYLGVSWAVRRDRESKFHDQISTKTVRSLMAILFLNTQSTPHHGHQTVSEWEAVRFFRLGPKPFLKNRDDPYPEEMNVKYRHVENTQSFLFHLLHTDLVTCGSLLVKHGDIFKINQLMLYKIHQKKTHNFDMWC